MAEASDKSPEEKLRAAAAGRRRSAREAECEELKAALGDDIELVTLDSVDWFNHRRIHGEILPGRRKFITQQPTRPPAAVNRAQPTGP